MKRTKKFYQMMSEIQGFLESELEMNQKAKSFIDNCNLLLFRYQTACFLHQKYKSQLCILVLNTLYDKQDILSNLSAMLVFVHLSDEKSQWDFKKELSKIGLEFFAPI